MARWNENGGRIVTTIFEAAAFQYTVKATCQARGCSHWAVFQPHALWWLFQRKGWSDEFRYAHPRFRCTRCGAKRAKLEAVIELVTIEGLPMPPDTAWRRAVSRFRS